MSNTIGWGKGASNNSIGWGNVGTNGFGGIYSRSNSGETDLAGGGFDDDYISILEYATIQGYTLPSTDQQQKQNTLIKDLKNANVWNQLDSFACFATNGDSDFALIDWKRLQMMTAVNAPIFNINQGFKGDGVSSYIDTNFNPLLSGVNYSLNSSSFGGYFFDIISNNVDAFLGCIDATSTAHLIQFITPDRLAPAINVENSGIPMVNIELINSFFQTNRINSEDISFYQNENKDIFTNTSLTIPNDTFHILARDGVLHNQAGSSIFYCGSNLDNESLSFNSSIQKYKNSI